MTLRIRTNISALTARRHLGTTSQRLNKVMEKLSSGRRINRAADDAAGLAIAEGINSDVRALAQAQRNANDGVSLLQVAEGGLAEITNITVRLKELAVQAASDTIGKQERLYLNREFQALKYEIERIAMSTEFNDSRLIAGGQDIPEELAEFQIRNPLELQIDKNYYKGIDSTTTANPINVIRLDFTKVNASLAGEESLKLGVPGSEEGTRVDEKESAQASISRLGDALDKVSLYRARIGALQNRLTSTSRNLGTRIENLSSAQSRIMDTDFAEVTADLTQYNILAQAGASVLSQATQLPQVALKLLQ